MNRDNEILKAIHLAFKEDMGDGDHSSLACVPKYAKNKAKLIVKQYGLIAGVDIAQSIFNCFGNFEITVFIQDGIKVKKGDVAFEVYGSSQGILACERLVLNVMQRMSGIATYTSFLKGLINNTKAELLDTRKTTPNFRVFEKEAVRIGGGINHRFGLYDMIMLKDNHLDYAGGVRSALNKSNEYLKDKNKELKIEIEVRNFKELEEALDHGGFHRVMFDNFTPEETIKAVEIVGGKFETESSGEITEQNIRFYAEAGVDFISVGALTHQVKSLDLSLKAF
jgi:nicotinate-nucleotide pyrophosphorylase (carboxylating)